MRRDSGGASESSCIQTLADREFLDDQLAREKLSQYMDANTGEILRTRRPRGVERTSTSMSTAMPNAQRLVRTQIVARYFAPRF